MIIVAIIVIYVFVLVTLDDSLVEGFLCALLALSYAGIAFVAISLVGLIIANPAFQVTDSYNISPIPAVSSEGQFTVGITDGQFVYTVPVNGVYTQEKIDQASTTIVDNSDHPYVIVSRQLWWGNCGIICAPPSDHKYELHVPAGTTYKVY